jgi:DNA-binding transcriptional LysR family regulator
MPAPVPATGSGENQELAPWSFERGKNKLEIEVKGPLIVNDVDLMIKAARNGIGIGYVAESDTFDDISEGRLVPLLTDWSPAYTNWYLYCAGRRQLPASLKAFIRFLREYLHPGGTAGPPAPR